MPQINWSGLGLNYAVNFTRQYYDGDSKLKQKTLDDLDYFASIGISKIRVNIVDYSNEIANNGTYKGQQNLVLEALRRGFYVIFGLTSNPTTLTASNFANYINSVLNVAIWAQANCAVYPGMFELCIGNEEENHIDGSLTTQQVRDELRILASDSQLLYTAGPISTAIAQGKESGWIVTDSGNLGGLDKLSINVYGHSGDFNSYVTIIRDMYAAYGTNTYISEFNLHSNWAAAAARMVPVGRRNFELAYLNSLHQWYKFAKDSGMDSAYFFAHHDNSDNWSVRTESTTYPPPPPYRPAWSSLFTNRRVDHTEL